MKKLLYVLILGAAMLTPERKLDIGKLLPVELVYLGYENGMVVLGTDTGDVGRGIGIAAALDDLEETAAGVIYLDTAEHLLVAEDAQVLLPDLMPYLKENLGVFLVEEALDLTEVTEYLSVHKSPVLLAEIRGNTVLPVLIEYGESFLQKR